MDIFASNKVELPDGREIVVKQPNAEKDLENLVGFFTRLPAEVQNYLRYNVADIDFCRRRLEQVDNRDHWRLIAELNGEIVGDATLDREPFGWTRHVAELRGVLDPAFRKQGIGSLLCNMLVVEGASAGIERLFTEVMREQVHLIEMLEKAGFQYEATRKSYAKDLKGKLHDVIIMSNDLESVWKRLAEKLVEMDIKPFSTGL